MERCDEGAWNPQKSCDIHKIQLMVLHLHTSSSIPFKKSLNCGALPALLKDNSNLFPAIFALLYT